MALPSSDPPPIHRGIGDARGIAKVGCDAGGCGVAGGLGGGGGFGAWRVAVDLPLSAAKRAAKIQIPPSSRAYAHGQALQVRQVEFSRAWLMSTSQRGSEPSACR